MENNNEAVTADENVPLQNKSKKHVNVKVATLIIVGCFLLAGLGVVAGYVVGINKSSAKETAASTVTNNSVKSSDKDSAKDKEVPVKESDPATHFVAAQGTPFDLRKAVSVKLGVPNFVQAVRTESGSNNRGAERYLTDKFNDEIARWTIGYPEVPQGRSGDISFLAIGDSWLKASQEVDGFFYVGGDINTPEQKAAYIAKLKKDSQDCAQAGKAIAWKGEPVNICYTVTKSKYGENGVMNFKGYGTVAGRQVVVLGYVDLSDTKQETVDKWTKSLAQTTVSVAN